VRDEGDSVHAATELRQADLLSPGGGAQVLLRAEGQILSGGRYRVHVESDVPNPALPGRYEGADYEFVIVVSDSSSASRRLR
jgi:hypothetical protein